MAVYEIEVTQMLVIDQSNSKVNPSAVYATNTLVIMQLAKNFNQSVSAYDFLNIGQTVDVRKSINNQSVSQFLEIHDGGFKYAAWQTVTDYLILGSLARLIEYEIVTQTILIVETLLVDLAKATTDTLALMQTAACNVVRSRTVTETIVIFSGGMAIIEDDDRYSITLSSLTGPNAPECS